MFPHELLYVSRETCLRLFQQISHDKYFCVIQRIFLYVNILYVDSYKLS